MDTVSYSREDVIQILNDRVLPVRIAPENLPVFKHYSIKVTPAQVMIGAGGYERQRSSGFLDGQELMAFLLLGVGKFYFDDGRIDDALDMVNQLIGNYPESRLIPEAMFHAGFLRYKKTLDYRQLKESYRDMENRFPSDEWTQIARRVALYHYAASVWEWSQKKDNINNARFAVILTSLGDKQ
ncbi:MAG: hypothetical protein JW902_18345 [Syntrophaceae bacterium]|nr:hypothetical protein [Syntrophaceae bacterium]